MFKMEFLTPVLLAISILGTPAVAILRSTSPAEFIAPDGANLIPNSYMVLLYENCTLEDHYKNIGMNLSEIAPWKFSNWKAINGYAIDIANSTIIQELVRYDPCVRFVEQNQRAHVDFEIPYRVHQRDNSTLTRRWELDRKSQDWPMQQITANSKLKIDKASNEYTSALAEAGKGVDVYIIDSGIRLTHRAFGGRATNFRNLKYTPYLDINRTENVPFLMDDDQIGHGTHVAGIIGSEVFGVAPKANLINVKVFGEHDGINNGFNAAGMTHAVLDITEEHLAKSENPPAGWKGSVINFSGSITGDFTSALRVAFNDAFLAGIPIAVAAGNGIPSGSLILPTNTGTWGGYYAPCAWSESVMCVGATDSQYKKAHFSNYGDVVEIFAPGVDIFSSFGDGDGSYALLDGTSMATPFVAGFMATIVGHEGLHQNASEVRSRVISNQLNGILDLAGLDNPGPEYMRLYPYAKTKNAFLNTGISNPNKRSTDPYLIPHPELEESEEESISVVEVMRKTSGGFTTYITLPTVSIDTYGPTTTVTIFPTFTKPFYYGEPAALEHWMMESPSQTEMEAPLPSPTEEARIFRSTIRKSKVSSTTESPNPITETGSFTTPPIAPATIETNAITTSTTPRIWVTVIVRPITTLPYMAQKGEWIGKLSQGKLEPL